MRRAGVKGLAAGGVPRRLDRRRPLEPPREPLLALEDSHGCHRGRRPACQRDLREVLRLTASTRNSTIRRISSAGTGWSSGNCTVPFAHLYSWISSLNAAIPLAVRPLNG